MSKKDTITKKYMSEPRHFADLFNGYIYNGKEVIKAGDLTEVDTTSIAVIPYANCNKNISVQKYRDILKKTILMKSDRIYYLFLGIENQSDIHYAMPVRNLLYDGLLYNQQIETIAKHNKAKGIFNNSNEFLSGFTKNDKLIPIVTVTVYWGTESWDAPTTLKDMMLDMDDRVASLINDYNCNLFSIIDADELPVYRTELNELFNLLKTRNNKNDLYNLLTNNPAYQNIDSDTALMMREFANIKLPRKEKDGGYNMCKAVMELKRESEDIKAIEMIKNAMKNTNKSFIDVCEILGVSKADMARYKKMI